MADYTDLSGRLHAASVPPAAPPLSVENTMIEFCSISRSLSALTTRPNDSSSDANVAKKHENHQKTFCTVLVIFDCVIKSGGQFAM